MKARFYLLALLAGIFMIVALPVGVVFFIFVAMYYLISNKEENDENLADSDRSTSALNFNNGNDVGMGQGDSDKSEPTLNFNSLFNDDTFVKEQEKLR